MGAYLDYLRRVAENKGFDPEEQIRSIEDSTGIILPYINRTGVLRRPTYGLVVGDVQSGKTANFCGLISRACDIGVPLVIVISGSTKVLRNKTQNRLDLALGREGRESISNGWLHLTKSDWPRPKRRQSGGIEEVWESGDFPCSDIDPEVVIERIRRGRPAIMVVKKNDATLERVLNWLECYSEDLSHRQILFIDDESDSASVNLVRPGPRRGGR